MNMTDPQLKPSHVLTLDEILDKHVHGDKTPTRHVFWSADGMLQVTSASHPGHPHTVSASPTGELTCDGNDLGPCPGYGFRGMCGHIIEAAQFIESHNPTNRKQSDFAFYTYKDPMRRVVRIRRSRSTGRTLESIFG